MHPEARLAAPHHSRGLICGPQALRSVGPLLVACLPGGVSVCASVLFYYCYLITRGLACCSLGDPGLTRGWARSRRSDAEDILPALPFLCLPCPPPFLGRGGAMSDDCAYFRKTY